MTETRNRGKARTGKVGLVILFAGFLAILFAVGLVVTHLVNTPDSDSQLEQFRANSIARAKKAAGTQGVNTAAATPAVSTTAAARVNAVPAPREQKEGPMEPNVNLSTSGKAPAWHHMGEKDPWPTFYGDVRRTGRGTGHGARGVPKWQFQTHDFLRSSPTIGAGGVVYVGGGDQNLYALNASSGQQLWKFTGDSEFNNSVVLGSGGRLYVGNYDGNLYALGRSDGRVLWKFTVRGNVTAELAIGEDGTVFATGNQGDLYAVNGATGVLKWTRRPGHDTQATEFSPALGSSHRLYIASSGNKGSDRLHNGQITALDSRSGDEIWSFQADTYLSTPVSIGDDGTGIFSIAPAGRDFTAPGSSETVV